MINNNENIGGITFNDVITFQTQIILGNQFGRLLWVINESQNGITKDLMDELLIACLRMGWNDAFRHVSENVEGVDERIATADKKNKINGHQTYGKQSFHDYFSTVLANKNKTVVDIYHEYATKNTLDGKCDCLIKSLDTLKEVVGKAKKLDGKKMLCFGHFQKMFNIASKLYLCIYMCREQLGLKDELFYDDIIEGLEYADCPIDSIVLNKLDEKGKVCKYYEAEEYRKYGEDEKGRTLLNKKFSDIVWSKIGGKKENSTIEGYKNVQRAIEKLIDDEEKSRLYFDFKEWKNSTKD